LRAASSLVRSAGGASALPAPFRFRGIFRAGPRQIAIAPPGLQDRIARAGGRNLYDEPNFRIVWGWSRLDWIWSRKAGGYERRPKYPNKKNRWLLEQWKPALAYGTKESWIRQTRAWIYGLPIEVNGPYPSRGDYELVHVIETDHCEGCQSLVGAPGGDGQCQCGGMAFVALTLIVCDNLIDLVARSREMHAATRRNRKLDSADREERDYDVFADDVIRDAQPILDGQPYVTVPRNYGGKEDS
jgi:hypothetical protein